MKIIIVRQEEYGRPYNGKKWENNFWVLPRAWKVVSENNNGTIKAVRNGKVKFFTGKDVTR